MLFSIITPVLNGEKFLGGAIASIQAQTYENLEHIIVDGGSTDNTLNIAQEAVEKDSRISVLERPGLKQYPAIVYGIEQANGNFIAWLNADDLYAPWALASVADAVKKDDRLRWLSGLPGCWDEDGVLRFIRPEGWRPQALIKKGWFHKELLGFIQQESVFFSRTLFENLSDEERQAFVGAELAGDFILWRAFARMTPLVTLPAILGGFRRHNANRSITKMELYMTEARAAGAMHLPSPVAAVARALYWRFSALAAARLAQDADRNFPEGGFDQNGSD